MNSRVSKQWFCDRYCMKAPRVHGGGAVFDRTSCNVGRRGQYGPDGTATLSGRDGRNSPDDMKPSSSASQSEMTDEQRGDVSLDDVYMDGDGGFRCLDSLDFRIALRIYFIGTREARLFESSPQANYSTSSVTPRRLSQIVRDRTVFESYRPRCICRKAS